MAGEKAQALVLRTSDWSETSRIATMWTRELGRVRVLAKGGRRLKSNFETALDLLTLCRIVFVRKSSGSLDLLTEAQLSRRFPRLATDLGALYAGYHVAELLADWTEDYDPHPNVFDEALATLENLGQPEVANGPRLARFELVFLRELGYGPALVHCGDCGTEIVARQQSGYYFSPARGGMLCPPCRESQRDRQGLRLMEESWQALRELGAPQCPESWRAPLSARVRTELRQTLNQYETYLRGRRPRLVPYLGS
ncbi:MAG: DNA repair protein RecO [Gemmataceae bacterium]